MPLTAWRDRPELVSAVVVVLVALLATVTGLGNGFAYDDIPIIVENPMVQQLHSPWAYLTDSYWGPSRGNSLYRPVTIVAYALERAVGAGSPFPFHLANVVLYVGAALAVLLLARELLPAGAALLASVLWAVHPVHSEAVANVVGQSEMLAGIPLLLAVVLYVRDRRLGALRRRTIVSITALMAFALLCKEHGIVLPGLLVAAELAFRGRGFVSDRTSDRTLAGLALAIVLLVVAYFVVRFAVLNGVLGDAPHPALEGLSRGQRTWVMLALVPDIARLLLWPARLYADYSPQAVPFLTSPAAGHLGGAAVLLLYVVAVAAAWRRDRSGVALFALLWLPVTFALVSNVVFASGVLIAERTLFLPSLTVAMLAGWGAARVTPLVAVRATPIIRVALGAGVAGLFVVATVHSAERQKVWEDNATLFATTVVDAPDNFRAHHALGELFGGAGAWDRAEHHLRIADSLFPRYDLLELSLARVLHFDDRCPDALPLYDSVLMRRKDAEVALIGRAACRLEMRQLSAARADAVAGIARGQAVGAFGMILQKAESSLVANDTVDARNRWWRAGAPVSKSSARLKVPVLLMRPATSGRGRRMPQTMPDSARK
jgi:hypothetical protein